MNFTKGSRICVVIHGETLNCTTYTSAIVLTVESALTIFFNGLFLLSFIKRSAVISISEVSFVALAVTDVTAGVLVLRISNRLPIETVRINRNQMPIIQV